MESKTPQQSSSKPLTDADKDRLLRGKQRAEEIDRIRGNWWLRFKVAWRVILRGATSRCSWCGWQSAYADYDAMRAHHEECSKHPMQVLKATNAQMHGNLKLARDAIDQAKELAATIVTLRAENLQLTETICQWRDRATEEGAEVSRLRKQIELLTVVVLEQKVNQGIKTRLKSADHETETFEIVIPKEGCELLREWQKITGLVTVADTIRAGLAFWVRKELDDHASASAAVPGL